MHTKIALLLDGLGLISCIALLITMQKVKHLYPTTAPDWIILWVLGTVIVGSAGLLFTVAAFMKE